MGLDKCVCVRADGIKKRDMDKYTAELLQSNSLGVAGVVVLTEIVNVVCC